MARKRRSGRSRPRTKYQAKVSSKEQDLHRSLEAARKEVNRTYDAKQAAWYERDRAQAQMQQEYENREAAYAHHNEVWAEFGHFYDVTTARIATLREEASAEHQAMQICFRRSREAYTHGNKSEAPLWSSEARDYRDCRNRLYSEIDDLTQAIELARAKAEAEAPRVDDTAFEAARSEYQAAKERHEALQVKLQDLTLKRDRLQIALGQAQIERLKAEDDSSSQGPPPAKDAPSLQDASSAQQAPSAPRQP